MKKLFPVILLWYMAGCLPQKASFKRYDQSILVDNNKFGFKMNRFIVTTNNNVFSDSVKIVEANGKKYLGIVVLRDTQNNIALVKAMKESDSKFWEYTPGIGHYHGVVYTFYDPLHPKTTEVDGIVEGVEREAISVEIKKDCCSALGAPVINYKGEIVGVIVENSPEKGFILAPVSMIEKMIKEK